jgi:predicted nucleic acid-binding protein
MIVVDVMVLAYGLLPYPQFVDEVEDVRARDDVWVSPPLWRSEMRSTLMQYVRSDDPNIVRSDLTLDDARGVMRAERWGQVRPVRSNDVFTLADASGRSPYDCEYVALTQDLDVPLVTYNRPVLDAFPHIAVHPREFVQ